MSIEANQTQTVRVSGKGENKIRAISDAMSKIQKQILKNSKEVTLRIEPISVEVCSAKEISYTEKFLFFFFPRQRTSYEIELEIQVELLTIDAEVIPFTQNKEEAAGNGRIPFLSKLLH